jgi:MFS family permease
VVFVAALAMSATLPGRTHGLGLIETSLIADLGIAHTHFAWINFVTCLLGTACCLPVGYFLDRLGVRPTLTAVTLLLGLSVMAMARVVGPISLFVSLLFVRGLGQSALSVVSMAAVGKSFRKRLGVAMGVYSVLLTFGFIGGVLWVGSAVQTFGWRNAWMQLGVVLLIGIGPLSALLLRRDRIGTLDEADADETGEDPASDFTLGQALRSPAFWVIAGGAAQFNLVWSALTLFNESILAERGFDAKAAISVMAILTGSGLAANLLAGVLARRDRIPWLLGCGLTILALSLAAFPRVTTISQLYLYATAMGITGGLIMVVFFAAWRHLFGRSHLGRIQGAAQLISVFASAIGPALMAEGRAATGSHAPMFYVLAIATGGLAVAAFVVRLPIAQHGFVFSPASAGVSPLADPAAQET